LISLALTLAAIAAAAPASGEEQTRDTYKAQVEPLCQANREANERIMAGARERVNKGKLELAGKQFIRVSVSFGGLIRRLAPVAPPVGDERRIERWFVSLRLVKRRLRKVGRYYEEGLEIKAAHEGVLVQRAAISANNTSIVLHFHYCRFSRFD
jgi:hypothetical protein